MVDFIKTSWAGSSPLAKVMFVLFLSLILVFTGLGAYWLLKDEYEVVYDDLTQQDAAAIVSASKCLIGLISQVRPFCCQKRKLHKSS